MISKFASRFFFCLVGLGSVLLNPAWAADPDLTGYWFRPMNKGFAMPNELPPLLRSLPRTDATKAKLAFYNKLVPPNPTGPLDSAGAFCVGAAMPTITLLPGGYPMEIIQRLEQIIFLYELDRGVRHIYLKDKVAASDQIASRPGYSWGKWEGDTLVIETTSLTDTFESDVLLPHTDKATVMERYRLSTDAQGNKFLNMEMTLTDPASYEKPAQISTQLSFLPKGRLLSYECELWDARVAELRAKLSGK